MPNSATHRELMAIQRKLDRWELEHLREHSAEMAQRLEAALAEIEDLKRRAQWADDRAEMFEDFNRELMDQMGTSMGLTRAGSLVVMEGAAS